MQILTRPTVVLNGRMYQKMDLKPVVLLLICLRFSYVLSDVLMEGTECVMEDGNKGICMKQSDCPFVNKNKKKSPYTYCQYSVRKPIVCCLDCNFIKSRFFDGLSMKMSLDFAFELNLTDSKKAKHERCLQALSYLQHFSCNKYEEFKDLDVSVQCFDIPHETKSLAVREFDTRRNDNHHLALIGYGDSPDHAIWMCSGSVISDKYILTAAHCTSNPAMGVIKFAALGVPNQMDQRKYWQVYDVVRIIVHPDYRPPSKYDDIALLETGTKIMYNQEVIPACLHRGMDTGPFAMATGWRDMEQSNQSEMLRGAVLRRYSDVECMVAYPKYRHLVNGYNRNKQVCYGDSDEIDDFCEGDSGGSLQVKNNMKNAKCLYTIIGVTSYGRACGHFGSSGLYTRVDYYVRWIESITGRLS